MINIFDENNKFIEPLASTKTAPGYLLTSQAKKIKCTHAMHFSSFHKYVRTDSIWANKYTTPENDLDTPAPRTPDRPRCRGWEHVKMRHRSRRPVRPAKG